MGSVDLAVTDGDTALRFYRDYVGLTPLPTEGDEIRLGAGSRQLVVLHPDAERPVVPKTSGLYHLAIVLPARRDLARVIARLARLQWDQYPTDHVMTKANYLWDPDGNGIEIYVESPEDGTMGMVNGTFGAWDKDGRPRSGRDPINLEEMFSHLEPDDRLDEPLPDGSRMGHVHLHVADVDEALRFYVDLVGFDVMGHMPGVGFISAGGYHHHLGLNTWAGKGARPAPAGSAGLRRFTIELPAQRDLDDVVSRLEHGKVRVTEEANGLAAVDPSANRVLFRVADEKS
jgi:catechol 2,3-dioxygenase